MTVEPDKLHLKALELIERRMEYNLRSLREFRRELESVCKDKGVLGSRGLTEFVMGVLQTKGACNITELLESAETAGYAIPTRRILSKRLTERAYRVGDIVYEGGAWRWKG